MNPIHRIIHSKSPRGIKVIALSLLLVFVCALPYMLAIWSSEGEHLVAALSWLFALGALVSHLGFLIGMLLLILDGNFFRK